MLLPRGWDTDSGPRDAFAPQDFRVLYFSDCDGVTHLAKDGTQGLAQGCRKSAAMDQWAERLCCPKFLLKP